MISHKTEELLRKLLAEQPHYKPSAAIIEKLRHINMACFVGACCMGKTTLMDALAALDPECYGKTRNFTSREPRADDDPKRYYYYQHTDIGLEPVFGRIASGENLQHNINPYTLIMYGSEVTDYPHPMNMGDIFSSSIDGFRQLGFGTLWVFSVVTDPDTWVARVEERFPQGHPHRESRIREAIDSLEWSLAQSAADHRWVYNPAQHLELAATSVDSVIRGDASISESDAKAMATACLERAKELLVI